MQLRFALARNGTLPDDVKARLRALAGQRVTDAGELLIVARNRAARNTTAAMPKQRLLDLVRRALVAPKKRHATKPTRASKERRLYAKARSQKTKRLRGSVRYED